MHNRFFSKIIQSETKGKNIATGRHLPDSDLVRIPFSLYFYGEKVFGQWVKGAFAPKLNQWQVVINPQLIVVDFWTQTRPTYSQSIVFREEKRRETQA